MNGSGGEDSPTHVIGEVRGYGCGVFDFVKNPFFIR
jgi:hypothetical protein